MTSVRVYCRVRPFNKRETALGNLRYPIVVQKTTISVPERKKNYEFDANFDSKATQADVFNVVGAAVINDFMEGFNSTQFVYGQTGAGKSWTMMGLKENPEFAGLIPRSSECIFDKISERPDGWKFEIECSYLEIYMERVNDLLDPDKQNLDVKESKADGVFVPGLTRESVASREDIYEIIDRGDKIRKVAATKMNAGSSRSHSVLSIYLEQVNPDGVKTFSQLNLVDLAGSERASKTGATGEVLKQGTLINLSLTVLSQVISGLSKSAGLPPGKKGLIPYRSSKLTRLLQTSLGGNAKTGLSVHASPHEDNLDESVGTFEFGKRAKLIKNNAKAKVQKSAEQLERELEKLQAAHDKLKKAFAELSGGKMPAGLGDDDGGGGGGGGASSEELEAEKAKVEELEEEAELNRKDNDNLKMEIANLEEQLQSRSNAIEEYKKDFEVKDLEVRALQSKLRELGAADDEGDMDFGDDETGATGTALTTNTVGGFKASNPNQNAALAELNSLVNKQKDMLNRVRLENKELRQENVELTDELEEKTRRLALAELQVMRYENARNRVKDNKIKVKITPGKAKPSPIWRNLLMDRNNNPSGGDKPKFDYEKHRRGTILEKFGGLNPVPPDELKGGRSGPLEERLYQKTKFVKRWFVLRDSLLFCYESEDSPSTEPRFCIPLSESKIGSCPKQGDHEFCFMVLCGTYFNVMAAGTESEKSVWLKDLNYAKFVTHEVLMNLAYFNRCAVDAIQDPSDQQSMRQQTSNAPYAMIGDKDYVHEVPSGGGMEGFLATPGFKLTDARQNSMFSKELRKDWKTNYFILKDSHLLMYDLVDHSELVTEPKGVLYMGSQISVVKQHDEPDDPEDPNDTTPTKFYFTAMHMDNDIESIAMAAPSDEARAMWIQALNAACQVTVQNVMLAALEKESISVKAGINPPEPDLQGRPLDPLCVQPYDDKQKPLYRHPDGRTMTRDLVPTTDDVKRFSKAGQPLDFFNRALAQNAAPMFATNPVEPVGVGVDGRHYAYPSGRVLELSEPHYDFEGQPLHADTVKAADAIITALKVACIVRSAVLTRDKHCVFDAFGRPLKKSREGKLITLEGAELPSTADVFDSVGSKMTYKPTDAGAVKTLEVVYMSNDQTVSTLGKLGVEVGHTTLADVHSEIKKNITTKVSSVTFLVSGRPIPEKEKEQRVASDYLPRILVSCRDIHGKRMTHDGKTFSVDVNHVEVDAAAAKDKETEFIKIVSNQKHKKSLRAQSRSSLVSPRSPRAP